ncbi:aroma-sacti cluster domain-containing protein [Streptomyces hydrogenans]|uniref:aroma-sacti cluster domain-containing protein n=1 Tax=Streptomyces hydrogenans TaxID=1873719 RepID=UPI003632A688
MAFDALKVLEGTGANIGALTSAQQQVFASLNPEEVAVLTAVQAKLNAATGAAEVTAQGAEGANGIC